MNLTKFRKTQSRIFIALFSLLLSCSGNHVELKDSVWTDDANTRRLCSFIIDSVSLKNVNLENTVYYEKIHHLIKLRSFYNLPKSYDCLFLENKGNVIIAEFLPHENINHYNKYYSYIDDFLVVCSKEFSFKELGNRTQKFFIYGYPEDVPDLYDKEWLSIYLIQGDSVKETFSTIHQ